MLQQDVLNIVRQYVANLNKGGIVIYKAFLFGSYARNQANENSDIDILVSLSAPMGIEFIDLADELETITGKKVDLVSREALKPRQLAYLETQLQYV